MASPVTDPELLAALNAPDPKQKVTDPALLAALNAPASAPAAAEAPSVAADVLKSGSVGLAKGVIGVGGAMGDLRHAASAAVDRLASPETAQTIKDRAYQLAGLTDMGTVARDAPSSGDIQKGVESVTGEFHKPQSVAGEYAQTMGEFAPALIGGPETLASRVISRMAIPALASETAGQLTKGTAAEPYARTGAALVSPFAGGLLEKTANLINGRVEGMTLAGGNRLISAVQADGGPAAVQQRLQELGPDATLADAGPALLGKAQGVSLNSDEGRSVLQTALTNRNTGTNARIQRDVNGALGPAQDVDAQTATDAITAHRSAVDAVNYPAALDNAPAVKIAPIMTDLIDRIDQTPVKSMEHKALTTLQEMLTKTEKRPLLDAQGIQQYDSLGNAKWQDVPVSHDSANVLHKVKGELDNIIQYDAPGLGVPAGALKNQQGALKQMRGSINDALETQVPGYAAANDVSSALAKRATAVDLGTQYLGAGKTTAAPGRLAAAFAPLEPGEKIAFAKGSRANIDRVLGTKANDLQALRTELQGEGGWNTAKLAVVHGQPAADALAGTVDRNLKFRDTYNKVVENSQTAQRQAAAKLENPNQISENDIVTPSSTWGGMALTAAKRGAAKVTNAMLEHGRLLSQSEMAHALTEQGATRDARLNTIVDAINRRQQNATATGSGNRGVAAVTAALLARQPASQRSQ